jgi:hypothetical protein
MIIVSQDKKMIINFENISGIVIRKNTDERVYQIQCKSEGEKKCRIIGKYETEERAKEVLNDIAEFYSREDYGGKRFEPVVGIALTLARKRARYVMPEH